MTRSPLEAYSEPARGRKVRPGRSHRSVSSCCSSVSACTCAFSEEGRCCLIFPCSPLKQPLPHLESFLRREPSSRSSAWLVFLRSHPVVLIDHGTMQATIPNWSCVRLTNGNPGSNTGLSHRLVTCCDTRQNFILLLSKV